MRINTLLLFLVFLIGSLNIQAQRTCAAHDNLLQQNQDSRTQQNRQQIEQFTQKFTLDNPGAVSRPAVITIPIVVHVVYRTAAENISDAQIMSQLQVLNDDFRRLNSDASNTPSDFSCVAADIEIEFCLAQIDPNGNPTTGITRTSTTVNGFGTNDAVKFASSGGVDAWPSCDYLNFWVCNIGGGILGYAQFPGGPAATDGVVNGYQYTGTIGTATAPFNLGRTATHEVGHWLNLRHIWGDTGCGGDDFVGDTPLAGAANYTSAPCTYPGPDSCNDTQTICGGNQDYPDMFQNYMDYSDDACMNLFTEGQKTRMLALFAPGGARECLIGKDAIKCAVPTCTDGIQNGDETGVDCGGATCPACPPSCTDGIMNQDETGVDCGGATCPACPTCTDGIMNGDETGIDCGGATCPTCPPTCTDGIMNQDETGIDCGGATCPACPTGCSQYDTGPFIDFNPIPSACFNDCTPVTQTFQVYQNESYVFYNMVAGEEYTFDFCNGYSASTWAALITVLEFDATTGTVGSEIAGMLGCSLTFTIPTDGDYVLTIADPNNCGGTTVSTDNGFPTLSCTGLTSCCGATFTDPGGTISNYPNNSNATYTMCPDVAGQMIEVTFTQFSLENNGGGCWDYINIYDGNSTGAPQIGGQTCDAQGSPGTVTSTSADGCLTFEFSSDGSVNQAGWIADVACIGGPVTLAPKVFLQGPFDTGSMMMNMGLTGMLPATSPYSDAKPLGSAVPANAVDWIWVEIRDDNTATPGTTYGQSALILNNGNIVDVDGAPLQFPSVTPGTDWYVMVQHRNHLGMMTANPVTLN